MKTSELVAEARDELFQGWVQSQLMNANTGHVCAVGALRRATMNNLQHGSTAVFKKARHALDLKAREMGANVAVDGVFEPTRVESFNDYRNTTQQDVLDLFDKTCIGLQEVGD